jgi:hypothetical protein
MMTNSLDSGQEKPFKESRNRSARQETMQIAIKAMAQESFTQVDRIGETRRQKVVISPRTSDFKYAEDPALVARCGVAHRGRVHASVVLRCAKKIVNHEKQKLHLQSFPPANINSYSL